MTEKILLKSESTISNHYLTAATVIKGTVERITFHNKENGFCVLQIRIDDQSELVRVVGTAATIAVGEMVKAQGNWENDKAYGKQFKAEHLQVSPPGTREGVEKYLASGAVKGVGQHYAKLLVQAFGESVFNVLDQSPERLDQIPGIGKKRRKQILSSWATQKGVSDVMVFLQSYGISATRAAKIYKIYGAKTIDKIRQNPYCLAQDISGIGFKTADEIAEKLEIPCDSPFRARAGLLHVLQEFSDAGHCAALQSVLQEKTIALLGIAESVVIAAIDNEIKKAHLIREETEQGPILFLASLYQAEVSVAEHLKRLCHGAPPWGELVSDKALAWAEQHTELKLSVSQMNAVYGMLQSKVFIITGGPGVGKTTIVKSVLTILRAKNIKIALCAPTGRAAKRLSETTKLAAKTIHRLLEYDPYNYVFQNNAEHPLDADLVIVDEVSMLDIVLMSHLLKAIPDRAALLLIGDVDQLPSVGPGVVLADLLASKKIPTVFLTEIFRQTKTSQIILNAHRINQGKMLLAMEKNQETDFYFISVNSPEAICNTIVELVSERIPQRFGFHPVHDIQVLTPMNRGGVGTQVLNNILQNKLNGPSQPKLQRFGAIFSRGDKVIQLVNNYDKDVFNGDIGEVTFVNVEKSKLTINFDGRIVDYQAAELDEIALAYAMSIHKSQGSEYPAVVIALAMQHYRMLVRNLLYTGVTRGKKLVVLVGQPRALAIAIETVQTGKRLTRLGARLA